jgi:hypothetical protein
MRASARIWVMGADGRLFEAHCPEGRVFRFLFVLLETFLVEKRVDASEPYCMSVVVELGRCIWDGSVYHVTDPRHFDARNVICL